MRSFVRHLRATLSALAAGAFLSAGLLQPAFADEQYLPSIWIDPDGCEHWALDDGAEGYMSPHLDRNGDPVCHRAEICGVMPTDQLFATDRSDINAENRQRLANFFTSANAFGFLIYGHTDSRASDEYNIALSERRAASVADVAQSIGARVVDVKGFGERRPRAVNDTPQGGMRLNRRVEIYCLR
ncbi:OmpA family protein [Pseudoroseicyclus tamaricis]|uniref:OmpA family protein n=1 Tax=Pseudoroseicyclus tamaricis TaxID=2705421 RepID=A0A6B2JUR1_9RHOB|nr:OmpA family protein [Pseudoroseicyclus tamaricis]NDV01800.1 OmpA family protein [Pseudoroseicyclus tamaricis]